MPTHKAYRRSHMRVAYKLKANIVFFIDKDLGEQI